MNIEDLLRAIPEKLIILEEYFNLNQTQMAEKAGMSRTLYSTIRRGAQTASIDFILKICITFGISLDWMLYNQGQMFKNDNELLSEIDQDWIEIIKFIDKFDPDTQLDYIEHMKTGARLIIDRKNQKKD